MIEAEPVAEFVSEQRFQIVGALALSVGERGGCGVDRLAIVAEQRVAIENLADELSGSGGADGDADGVGGDGAGEGQHAGGESVAGLVEANGVEAVDVVFGVVGTGVLGGDAGERRNQAGIGRGVEGGAGDAGPGACGE